LQKPYTGSAKSSSTTLVPKSSTGSLRVLDTVSTTATSGHLGTKVLVAAGQGRKSVVFAMEKNRFDTYTETDGSLSPRSGATNEVLFDTQRYVPRVSEEQTSDLKDLYPGGYGDFAQNRHDGDEQGEMEDLDLVSPIWSQQDPVPSKQGQGRSGAKTRRDDLVTDSIRAGPWGMTPAAKRQERAREEVRRKRWSNVSSIVEEKDDGVLGREWR